MDLARTFRDSAGWELGPWPWSWFGQRALEGLELRMLDFTFDVHDSC